VAIAGNIRVISGGRLMDNFEIAQKIDKLNDEIDRIVGLSINKPFSYEAFAKAGKIAADVSVELSKLIDELNREE